MSDPKSTRDPWGKPTRWSTILQATGRSEEGDMAHAWSRLMDRYRGAVLSSVRRVLGGHPETEDIVDDFFAYLYRGDILKRVKPESGRFRCFVQGVIKRYLAQVRRRRGQRALSIDAFEDFDLATAPDGNLDVDAEDEADWALAIFAAACHRLQTHRDRDTELLFRAYGLPPFDSESREELATRFGLERNAVNVAIHRAREHLREFVTDEIRESVDNPNEFRVEVDVMFRRLQGAKPELFDDSDYSGWHDEL